MLFLITVLFVVTEPAITNKGLEKTTLILNKIISEAIDVSNDVLLSIKDEEAPKVLKKENTEKIIPLKHVKVSTPEKAEDENANTSFLVMEIEPTNDKISIKKLKTLPAGYRIYKVKQGDTLWDIAKGITGNPFNYRSIAANAKIKNPDQIYPGQEIFIKIIQ